MNVSNVPAVGPFCLLAGIAQVRLCSTRRARIDLSVHKNIEREHAKAQSKDEIKHLNKHNGHRSRHPKAEIVAAHKMLARAPCIVVLKGLGNNLQPSVKQNWRNCYGRDNLRWADAAVQKKKAGDEQSRKTRPDDNGDESIQYLSGVDIGAPGGRSCNNSTNMVFTIAYCRSRSDSHRGEGNAAIPIECSLDLFSSLGVIRR